MKKIITLALLLIIFGCCLLFSDEIVGFTIKHFISGSQTSDKLENNEYALKSNYKYVQLTDDFSPENKKDLLNIFFTVINSGMDKFTFYCPKSYKNCLTDINYISNNQVLLSNINNYVHIYNSFQNIETEFDSLGKIDVTVNHTYTNKQISKIEKAANTILKNNITADMETDNKIKAIHDYIVNNTKYDRDRSDNKIKQYHSDTAYGPLIEHYAICGGYADSMKLFLDKMGIDNYKIASENHIWNLVRVNDEWLHLDLTWDDPVTTDGKDVLEYDYFLITTEELLKQETDQHIYDKTVYIEAS